MFSLPIQKTHILGPLCIIVLCTLLYFFEPTSNQWLAFDRSQLAEHQWWRLLTANFLHTNLNHLLLNFAGVLLLWALHGEYYRTTPYLLIFIFCALGSSIGIYFFAPRLDWYVGLSGALHGVFLWGAFQDIQHKRHSGWLLILAVWFKIIHEQYSGASAEIATLINATVAIEAHLYGALSGTLLVCYVVVFGQKKAKV
ncbi:MAG: rhomboid family GlyGly-CTERM serine protease [Paraglaciecola sp.]|jgi:rhomboid family GlyGly-CTERM serine protease